MVPKPPNMPETDYVLFVNGGRRRQPGNHRFQRYAQLGARQRDAGHKPDGRRKRHLRQPVDHQGRHGLLPDGHGREPDRELHEFSVAAGNASQLVFTQEPTNTTVGATMSNVVVTVEDANGNPVTTGSNVTLTLEPGNGTLGTNPTAGGNATFGNLSLTKPGTGYFLMATDGNLTANSTSSASRRANASQLVFTQEPSNTTAGATMSNVVVTVEDANGNPVTTGSNVTLSLEPGNGTLGDKPDGRRERHLRQPVDRQGRHGLLPDGHGREPDRELHEFQRRGGQRRQLVFTQEPSNTTAGATMSNVLVTVEDADGNPVTTGSNVTLSLEPGNGTLGTKPTAGGNATFGNLSIAKAGTGYFLTATDGNLTANSTSFSITAGNASQLAFTQEPSNTTAGATMSNVVVTVEDANGNPVTAGSNVTLSLEPGNGTLGTNPTAGGNATFGNLSIAKAGTGYFLTATDGNLTANSTSFSITAGNASQLVFTQEPSNTTAGATMSSVVVTVEDADGNPVTAGSNVTLSLEPGNGTLGTNPTAGGNATFGSLSITKAGTGYFLTATDGNLTANSTSFSIAAGNASQLAFTQEPTNTTVGATMSNVVVTVEDANGNPVTTSSNVTLSLEPGNGTLGTNPTVGGNATFGNLSLTKPGTGYFLMATDGNLTANSTSFSVAAGNASQLVFTQEPSNTTAGATMSNVVVTVEDADGNPVTTSSNVTLSLEPGNGTLGTNPTAGGNATFGNLSIAKAGTGYFLTATDGNLTANSTSFSVAAGNASQLVFTQEPSNTTAGATMSSVVVTVEDANGNPVTAGSNVTLSLEPGNGTLGTNPTAGGNATFGNLSIAKAGTGYFLTATDGNLTANSTSFSITAGNASQLVFTQEPSNTTAGATMSNVVVTVEDADGNPVTTSSNVTLRLEPGNGTLGTNPTAGGNATFGNLSIAKAGTGYFLTATDGNLTANSTSFSVAVGNASQLAFTQEPANTTAGATMSSVVVTVEDANGNPVTTSSNVTLTLEPGNGTLGTNPTAGGNATFGNLSITKAGTGYFLTATDGNLTANSTSFSVAAGNASRVGVYPGAEQHHGRGHHVQRRGDGGGRRRQPGNRRFQRHAHLGARQRDAGHKPDGRRERHLRQPVDHQGRHGLLPDGDGREPDRELHEF